RRQHAVRRRFRSPLDSAERSHDGRDARHHAHVRAAGGGRRSRVRPRRRRLCRQAVQPDGAAGAHSAPGQAVLMRLAIWRNTLLVIAVYIILIAAADREVFAPALRSRMLAGALSFASVQLAFIAIMLILLFARKQRNVVRTARSERLGPAIDEALALHSVGEDRAERLRELAAESRWDVREKLFAIASTTRGDARDRMTRLALDLGLVERGVDVEL